MMRRSHCSGSRFLYGIQLFSKVKKDVIRKLGFKGLLQLSCKELNLDLCSWLLRNMNFAYSQLELPKGKMVPLTSHNVGIMMRVPHTIRKLIVEDGIVKLSLVPSLKDIEPLMNLSDFFFRYFRVQPYWCPHLVWKVVTCYGMHPENSYLET